MSEDYVTEDSIAGRLSMKYRNKPPSEDELKELYGQLDSIERQFHEARTAAADDAKRLIDDKMKLRADPSEAVAALKAMVIMSDRGPQPKKFDEAMSWRDNDILARKLADAVLAKHGK